MLRLFRTAFLAGILPAFLLMLGIQTSQAGSAVWQTAPATSDWNTAGDWFAGGPPNGLADNATFTYSTRTAVSISANTQVNVIFFHAGGGDTSAFTITADTPFTLTISGIGILNPSSQIRRPLQARHT